MKNKKEFICKIKTTVLLLFFINNAAAQIRLPVYPDSIFSTYYHQRVSHFKTLPQTNGDIIFIGNSITDGAEWTELFDDIRVKNRGIGGDITAGVIYRIINNKTNIILLAKLITMF